MIRCFLFCVFYLVSLIEVSGIDFFLYIFQNAVETVGDDGLGEFLELADIVDDLGTEERIAIRKGRFVDDDFGAFGLDPFHDALYGGLSEVVGVGFHG